jgi:tungstate transport system permease protein
MGEIVESFSAAARLVASGDPELAEIVGLSLRVSLGAVALACAVGLPLGGLLGVVRFPGRGGAIVLLNAMMGLPPVVVGLLVYLVLSRSGPLGGLGWLFTPRAMVVAQWLLITPIVAALARETFEALFEEYGDQLRSLGAGRVGSMATLLYEGRTRLMVAVVAGLGRALAEVGAVLIVGGNIAHRTRVMTTSIALETSRGDLALALGLGMLLIALSIALNLIAHGVRAWTAEAHA